jgi:hypothetical protein
MSLRDRILAADDIGKESLHVPHWNVDVEVRTMSAVQRSRMLQTCALPDGSVDLDRLYPMLIIATVHDPETGAPAFDAEDISVLQEKSAAAIEFVAQKAMQMSGMVAKAVDEEGKDN